MGNATRQGERQSLTSDLWESIEPIFGEILRHPFLTGLADGTLLPERFRHYAIQDTLYLQDFARALSITAARSPDQETLVMFVEHVLGAMTVERELHEGFFAEFGLSPTNVSQTPMAPTTLAYSSYLLRMVYAGDYTELLGAILPCYWIYHEVGKVLIRSGSPDPLYQRWIDTYGGEEFASVVEAVKMLVDRVGVDLSLTQRAAMQECFVTASRYEWMFWQMGWTLECWPV